MRPKVRARTCTWLTLAMWIAGAGAAYAQGSTNFKLVPGVPGAGAATSSTHFKLVGEAGGGRGHARTSGTSFDAVTGFVGGAFSSVVTVSDTTVGLTFKAVAFPVRAADNSVSAVLSEFGAYKNTLWRFGHFSPADSAYMEPGSAGPLNLTTLVPGQGYWLITKGGTVATDVGIPVAPTTYNIALTAGPGAPARPAWNQIGNPFLFPVSVASLQVTDGVTTKNLTDPTNLFTENVVKEWNGTTFVNATVLNGRTGYWVRRKSASGTLTLIVPYQASLTGAPAPNLLKPAGANWTVSLTARQGDRAAEPLMVGTTDLPAVPGNSLNYSAAPGPPDQPMLRLHMPHTDWGIDNGDYVTEFRAPSSRLSWDFVVSGAEAPGEVSIDVSAADLPSDVSLRLVDDATGEIRALMPGHSLTLAATSADRHYRVEATSGGVAPATATTVEAFRIAYPNPFRSSVGLNFALARSGDIDVQIFDLQGRMVRAIDRREVAAGEHVLVWDGRDEAGRIVGSGVYLARYRAGSLSGIRRLVKVD